MGLFPARHLYLLWLLRGVWMPWGLVTLSIEGM
jgi:hypothetical protein